MAKIKVCFLLAGILVFALASANAQETFTTKSKGLTAEEMTPLALKDAMYYNFDEWFARFSGEINRL